MNFLNNILQRHANLVNKVEPRPREIFEQDNNSPANLQEGISENVQEVISKNESTSAVPYDPPQTISSSDTTIKDAGPSILTAEHDVSVENINSSKTELMRNDSRPLGMKNKILDLNPAEPVKNNVASVNGSRNYVSSKTEFDGQLFFNNAVEKNTNEEDDPRSPSSNAIPVSTPIMKSDMTAVAGMMNYVSQVHVNQNKQSVETLNWIRNIKNMISLEAGEKAGSPAQVIKVNIGRVDVRATGQQTSVKNKAESKPVMTLDEFLKMKNNNDR